jgi:hypothetical protein
MRTLTRPRLLVASTTAALALGSLVLLPLVGCSSTDSKASSGAGGSGQAGGGGTSSGRGGEGGSPAESGGSGGTAAGVGSGGETNGGETANAGNGGADDGEPPVDVAGEYTVSLTNGTNDCQTMWREGVTTDGVLFTVRQNGTQLSAEADGDAAVSLVVLTGTNRFDGSIHGHAFTLTARGPTVFSAGNCSYTVNAVVEGTIDGDTIEGTLTYSPVIGTDPACAQYDCAAVQDYTGTRPQAS